jgi:hypothetical protein
MYSIESIVFFYQIIYSIFWIEILDRIVTSNSGSLWRTTNLWTVFWFAWPKIRDAESAVIYGNFPARNVVPQAKFPEELKIWGWGWTHGQILHPCQKCCLSRKEYIELFEKLFPNQYEIVHRMDNKKSRNTVQFYAYLLSSNMISWNVCSFCSTMDYSHFSSLLFSFLLF